MRRSYTGAQRPKTNQPQRRSTPNRWTALPHPALVVGAALVVHCLGSEPSRATAPSAPPTTQNAEAKPQIAVQIVKSVSNSDLPAPVAALRQTLLDIAHSGHLEDLKAGLEPHERAPVLNDDNAAAKFTEWRAASPDGKGYAVLAAISDLLALDAAVIEAGPDAENGRLFVWPHVSERALDRLPPHAEVDLLRLLTPVEAAAMKSQKRWTGWRLAIGADGVWRLFAKAK